MRFQHRRERLLASTMICGVVALGVTHRALAQPATGAAEVSEVVVTGSRIAQPNLRSVSPVTVVGSVELQNQGTTRVEDLINNLPQAFADQGGNVSNGASGTANVNLRNLGPTRTLVLIDGKRLLPGDPSTPAADLNNIPAALVDRVEVVTGGASAVYGSDAVAGVVNFIMKKDFEGVRIDAQYSGYQHDNDNKLGDLVTAAGYPRPSGSTTGGGTTDITVVLGVNSPDGKGNLTAYASYRNIKPVIQGERDFSACSFGEAGATFSCTGSGTTSPARFIPDGGSGPLLTLDRTTGALRAYTGADAYNFAPLNHFQRPDERYSLGAFGHYELSEAMDVYAQLMFIDDRTVAQIAPSGLFQAPGNDPFYNVNCSNPLLSAAQVNAFCTAFGLTAADTANILIGKRNVEGGPRQDDLRHTDYRIVLGLKGDLADNWHYDVSAQFGRVVFAENYQGEFSNRRVQNALNVVTDPRPGSPTLGQPVCASVINGTDTNCVPYNPFSLNAITPAQLNYVQVPGFQEGSSTEQIVSASVSGDLTKYGIKTPWAEDGLAIALGAEYRRDSLELRTDAEFQSNDLAGQGTATLPFSGAVDVYELFGEARLPLAQNQPWADTLSVETGYRFSDYNLSGTTHTYKFGADYAPVKDVRFRASYNRAARAPNAFELFDTPRVALDGTTDPCAVANPGVDNPAAANPIATLANCARTGVSPAQYGNILANSASQYNGLLGGNRNLRPEISDTYSVGAVMQPRFLPGFSLSLDYFNITVKDLIGIVGADFILNQCLTSGNPTFCSLIVRSPGTGSLFLGSSGFVTDTNQNTGSLKTKGLDVEANYRLPLADWGMDKYGSLSLNFVGTYTDSFVVEPLKGFGSYDCQGLYGSICLTPIPKWRHKARLTWATPWNLELSGQWRYIASVEVDTSSSNPLLAGSVDEVDRKLGSRSYIDATATWHIKEAYTLRAGVNNIFDKDPPIVGSAHLSPTFGNGNTYPQVYDALGRYIFVGLTATF